MTDGHMDSTDARKPDANTGREIRYPENRVVGLLDTPQQVASAVDAMTAGGILRSEIEVVCGDAAAERLRENTGRTGLADLVMRFSQFIGMPNDEAAIKGRYADALEGGKFLLSVLAASDERRDIATRILGEHGGTGVKFFGKHTIHLSPRAD